MRAVVFAYHNVGVRCLKVVCARGIEIALVVTHEDDLLENIWFDSVAANARELGLRVITPARADSDVCRDAVRQADPDFIFSFYYRQMLPPDLLGFARHGAYNMHGSLLPKYRGRAPVNWAILNGETETGATLHEMTAKPDAGAIIDQTAIPILPDDDAPVVFAKVTVAAEQTLWRALPGLMDGSAIPRLNDLGRGSYFGARKPEDGRIDWKLPAQNVYNLIRAVAPPYPGAFCDVGVHRFTVTGARPLGPIAYDLEPGLAVRDNQVLGVCGDGRALSIKHLLYQGSNLSAAKVKALIEPT